MYISGRFRGDGFNKNVRIDALLIFQEKIFDVVGGGDSL